MSAKLLFLGMVLGLSLSVSAKIELHSLFGDNMILQRDASNSLWGWVQPGATVEVKASWGSTAKTKADENGKWIVLLNTPNPGTGHHLTISSGRDIVKIKNVAVGEVWLCAGQSNMGFALGMMFTGEEDVPRANHPNYRIYKSAREHWHEPRERSRDRLAKWNACTPESAAEASAVSYYFGQKLHLELGIPVGIIIQAYAGTPIEGWMPKETQMDDPRTMAFAGDMDERSNRGGNGQTQRKAALATYEKELADYNARVDAGDIMKNKVRKIGPPFILRPPNMGHQYPANIYNAMIRPVVPYGIRGMIWYQGERNSKHVSQAFHYRNQLPRMISHYRSIWHNGSWGSVNDNFPVFITQLPSWKAPQTEPVEGLDSPWVVNRESMLEATRSSVNVGLAVSIDTGSEINLHPKNKKPIGIRHAYPCPREGIRQGRRAPWPVLQVPSSKGPRGHPFLRFSGQRADDRPQGETELLRHRRKGSKVGMGRCRDQGRNRRGVLPEGSESCGRALRLGNESFPAKPALQQGRPARFSFSHRRMALV
jgi:sialate O-acetylesterase